MMDRNSGAIRAVSLALLLALAFVLLLPTAGAQTPFAQARPFNGYATGTVVHTSALQGTVAGQPITRVENTDQAFSGSSVNAEGLAARILNEMERVVQPAQPGRNTFARGIGLELNLLQAPSSTGQGQVLLPVSPPLDAAALPSTDVRTAEVLNTRNSSIPAAVGNLAYASVIRSQTQARWGAADCVLGADLSRGLGYIADAQLVGSGVNADGTLTNPLLGLDAPAPDRAVSQSVSRNLLVRQVGRTGNVLGPNFGLMSENRQTIAPVTVRASAVPTGQITVEFLGEWVLQAVAGGVAGGAFVHYGPGTVSPQSHVLRVLDAAGNVVVTQGQRLEVTFQQIAAAVPVVGGAGGIRLALPNNAGEIVIAERPRAISGDFGSAVTELGDGTQAAGAIDVARIKLAETKDAQGTVTQKALEIRVGHMEARAQVPAGGISCSIPVNKVANPNSVFVGTPFTTTITVSNPFDCDLVNVRLTDDITVERAARFKVQGTDPAANTVPAGENLDKGQIVWNDIGPIAAGGGTKSVNATFMPQGGAGFIIDKATATGTLANCRGAGATVAGVASAVAGAGLVGSSNEVRVPVGAVLGETLARTGAPAPYAVAAGLALLALAGMGRVITRRIG